MITDTENKQAFIELRLSEHFIAAAQGGEEFSRELLLAYSLMKTLHAEQPPRRNGAAFYTHPLYVANYQAESRSVESRIVALLHDVVEDSRERGCWAITLDNLRELRFSSEIVDAVDSITRREHESYGVFIVRLARNPLAREVKKIDLEHNSDAHSGEYRPDDKALLKHDVYMISRSYLEAIDKGTVKIGTPINKFMRENHGALKIGNGHEPLTYERAEQILEKIYPDFREPPVAEDCKPKAA